MAAFGDNPFAALTLIAAPAVLTNASSVLALGTSNRFARAIDRARALAASLDSLDASTDSGSALRMRQLDRVERRSMMLLNALSAFYFSLGAFAAASLISLIGSITAGRTASLEFRAVLFLGAAVGISGVGGLVFGTTLLVRETRLAAQNLQEEAAAVREKRARFLTDIT